MKQIHHLAFYITTVTLSVVGKRMNDLFLFMQEVCVRTGG